MSQVNKRYFNKILKKYRLGTATAEEKKFLETYYNLFELNDELITADNEKEFEFLKQVIKNNIDQKIHQHSFPNTLSQPKMLWTKYAAAAILLFVLALGLIFYVESKKTISKVATNTHQVITPGGNKAVLTLANGKQIILDDTTRGQIATQAGVIISKTANGILEYKVLGSANQGQNQTLQNSISTPKGGQYKVILPDGTAVWLNAASSIAYPTSFAGNERLVSVTGEAYFEVAKDKARPFKIKSDLQTIEVLGTHFNVNAYADEPGVKTTLLEGSVKITSATNIVTITPGEQATVSRGHEGSIARRQVDTEEEVAWKNGVFSFKGEDIRSIMRQVARWYNIDVVCESNVSGEKYFGEISRSSSLSDVFKILELNNVKFTIEGKTVTVSDKK